jgi:hypothetical protein
MVGLFVPLRLLRSVAGWRQMWLSAQSGPEYRCHGAKRSMAGHRARGLRVGSRRAVVTSGSHSAAKPAPRQPCYLLLPFGVCDVPKGHVSPAEFCPRCTALAITSSNRAGPVNGVDLTRFIEEVLPSFAIGQCVVLTALGHLHSPQRAWRKSYQHPQKGCASRPQPPTKRGNACYGRICP